MRIDVEEEKLFSRIVIHTYKRVRAHTHTHQYWLLTGSRGSKNNRVQMHNDAS